MDGEARTALRRGFFKLGVWVAAHPRLILAGWLVGVALGAAGAQMLPRATVGGTGGIEGSRSQAVSDTLRANFSNPFIDPLAVAVSAPALEVGEEPYADWLRQTAQLLGHLPEVRRVASYADTRDPALRSSDGHVTLLLVGLAATDDEGVQRGVVMVRDALTGPRRSLRSLDPAAVLAVTGGPAGDFDVNEYSAAGGDRAEKRALPVTLAILALAFGTLVAACLPFLMGLATTTVALGAAFVLASMVPVSNLLSNVVTMVGLAIGIDYSLLMVAHFRDHPPQDSVAATVAGTIAEAGTTIAWSGVTVMVGFLGLLWSPILETRCAGIGGALVVCISVLAALTLLPALLVLLRPYLDRWPVIPRRLRRASAAAHWQRLGAWIVRHPLPTLIVSAGAVLALALPILRIHLGVTNEPWFLPPLAESRIGARILAALHNDNAASPILVIVGTADATPVLAAAHIRPLVDYAGRMQGDPRIAAVASPVTLRQGMDAAAYAALYANIDRALREHPSVAELYLSHDRRQALFAITPANGLSFSAIETLTRDVAAISPPGPFTVMVGGSAAFDIDSTRSTLDSLPRVFLFVVCATWLLIFAAFRSYLLPVKAVVTNLLAVAAGLGAVVAVFQFGWLNGWVGLERPFTAIPLEVPMMVFCLSFGLSMDYELFLLFRIRREMALRGDNARAVVAGLAAVAPVITGAGLIMAVVFGAFIGADLPVLKMMGVGLCVAVLIDATVIRAFVVPAAMVLAGRFNWYPGGDSPS